MRWTSMKCLLVLNCSESRDLKVALYDEKWELYLPLQIQLKTEGKLEDDL